MQYPLNQSQLGIYYASQLADADSNYTISCLFTLPKTIHLERLANALEQAVLVHPHLLDNVNVNADANPVWETPAKVEYTQTIIEAKDIADKMSTFGPDLTFDGERLFRFDLIRTPQGNYLCLNIHHILIDGLSINALLDDISKAYAGQSIEAENADARSINEAETKERETEAYTEQKQWYSETFGGIEGTSLPKGDGAIGREGEKAKWKVEDVKLDVDQEVILALSKQYEVGTSIPYTAAFALTLGAFTGDEDVSYATFYHGRGKEQLRTTNMMVRTLPMVHHLSQLTTVEELLKQTHTLLKQVRENSLVGFGEICEMSGINGDVSFIYQGKITDGVLHLEDEEVHWQLLSKHEPATKLNMQIREDESGLSMHIAYPADEYTPNWINNFAASYAYILEQLTHKEQLKDIIAATPEQLLQLDGFNEGERAKWLNGEEDIVDAFRAAAKRYPDNLAVCFGDRQYTYRKLDEITDALAAVIQSKITNYPSSITNQLPPVVSVLIHRNEQMTIWPLAILKAGCAYQPLDSSYPVERLNFMVKDANAALVVADPELRNLLSEYHGEFLMSDQFNTCNLPPTTCNLQPATCNLMILLYTSGSTGVPKGVMLSHRNVLVYSRWCQDELDITSESHVAAYASFGFDANMMDQYPTLLAGGTLYIIPEEIRLDLEAIRDFFETNRITNAIMTTQVAQQFAASFDQVAYLKHLELGGEKMMSMTLPSGYKMHNMYGPTECTVAVTHKLVETNEENIPIGTPTSDTHLYIVDKHLNRLPIGAPGELLVAGEQVGLGYLNQPEKTAQAFIQWQGKRVYRTGDIVRYRADGDIEFVGRRDGQVKIRGFRIELKEVEAVIHEIEGIKDVTVQAFDYPDGGKYLVAFFVADSPMDITQIEQYIRDQKPTYMVPAYTMQLEKIPLNVNQKVDKKALKALLEEKAIGQEGDEAKGREGEKAAPLNILEQELMEIMDKAIHQKDFDITTPLIYIGLSSIAAMKVANAVYKQYGVSLDVKKLVKDYSLQDIENTILTATLSEARSQTATLSETEIQNSKFTIHNSFPLTGAQKGIYLDWEVNRAALQYNVPMVLQLKEVDIPTLQNALTQVIKAHPALQIQLRQQAEGEVVMQTVEEAVKIEYITTKEAMDAEDLRQYMRSFNLLEGPLYHFVLVTDPQHHWLLMDIHHIIYDGLSAGILLQDLKKAYEGQTLEVESYSLLDYAKDEEQLRQSERYQEAKTYFDTLIDDIDMTHYPDSEEVGEQLAVLAHERTQVSRVSIEQTCHQLGITPNSYFATLVGEVLHRISREERVLFTTISNGRNGMQMMETIGMFVQTLIIASTKTKTTVAERMLSMHQQLQETLARDFYPFSELAANHHFTPQILYAFQDGVMDAAITLNGQTTPICTLDLETAKVPLSVQIKGTNNSFVIEIEYNQSLYNKRDMLCLSQMVASLAEQAVDTSLGMSTLTMIKAEDIPAIIDQSFGGKLDYDHERTLVDWVQHFAQTQPEHTAVVDYCSQLSYAELNRRTDILGHLLREKGVKKDTIVSIMLPRIKEFMVSYLAIHKAGGAYVPLDSEYPNERLVYMLENSESKVLITTRALVEQKRQEGDFPVPDMIFIDEIDWNQQTSPINFAEKDGLAYMIYTSGSTGKPKGTMLEHRNLMAFASWRINSDIPANPDNQFMCHPSFSFDASICDLIIPLFAGSTVHILHEDLRKDLDGLAEYITTHHIDGGSLPTQLGIALINHKDLPLKFIEMGGEKLVPTTPRSYRKINGYGPTEFTCCSSYYIVNDNDTNIPIGRPAPNTWSVIVDPDGHLMPWGIPGELCLIGEQMARGYWHLPEKTEQVFTPAPNEFISPSSIFHLPYSISKMYHTGDLAKYNEQGQLVYLGRIDHQVKLRGFRIEMGEIEARIASYPNVTATIVMVQEIGGSKHLVGYFVAEKKIDVAELKTYLQQTLTSYMVPDALVQMDAFPLTPNGKIDRKQMSIPELERSIEYIAPRNELEKQICDIFLHITGAQQVGVKDDFFEIGGSSLLAIKAVIELTNLGKKVVYGDLFKLKTPEALAKHINPENENGGSGHTDINQYYQFDDYNYEAIDKLLRQNQLPQDKMQLRELGTVLLTGATGYLGMHMLDYLVKETDSTIYCLVRPQGKMSGESRLKTLMVYYLTQTHEEQLGKRIHVLEDDITGKTLIETLKGIHIDTIFNCAALVKHFVVGKEMDEVNVEGVANLIAVAEEKKARLVHVSTYSTAGFVPASYLTLYNEQQLYIGQCTDNEYIRTKYLSERLMLQAIADGKIDGKVMRVGNLMARAEDGEFQINMHSNAFLNNLKSLKVLGQITSDMMAAPIEMSPIDCVATAIGKLALTPSHMVLFHPFNNYSSSRTVIIDAMREIGYPMNLVTPTTFQQSLQTALKDDQRSEDMQGIIHYTTNIENGLSPLGATNFYTTQVLLWLNFRWPMTTREYVLALLKQLDGLAFFE